MFLKKVNPVTNGTRHQIILCKNLLIKYNYLLKNLSKGIKKQSGRCKITGTISIRHQGGGTQLFFKKFINDKHSYISLILGIFHYNLRNSFIALHFNILNPSFFLTLATDKVLTGSLTCNNFIGFDFRLGYRCNLNKIPAGSILHSLPNRSNTLVKFIRSAGTYGQLLQKNYHNASIKLPSNRIINISSTCNATIGRLSNVLHNKLCIGKAGKRRNFGIRPTVRGIAMNPVDHPHGGRTNGGRPSVTPWGLPTRNSPTVTKKKYE